MGSAVSRGPEVLYRTRKGYLIMCIAYETERLERLRQLKEMAIQNPSLFPSPSGTTLEDDVARQTKNIATSEYNLAELNKDLAEYSDPSFKEKLLWREAQCYGKPDRKE